MRGPSTQQDGVQEGVRLAVGEGRAAGAKRTRAWSLASAVKEADLPIEAPVATPRSLLAKTLALC